MCSNSISNGAPTASCRKRLEVEVVGGGAGRHRRMEEPAAAEVDAAQELPVALELGLQHVVERLARIALQQLVQFARAEHEQHHHAVVVGAGLRQAGLLADQRAGAVAAHDIRRAQLTLGVALALAHRHRHPVVVLRHRLGLPAVERLDRGQLGGPLAQHRLGRVLRQPLVGGVVVRLDQVALQPVVVVARRAACRRRSVRRCRTRAGWCGPRAAAARHPRSGSAPSCAGSGSGPWESAAAAGSARRRCSARPAGPARSTDPCPPGPPPTITTSASCGRRACCFLVHPVTCP